MGSEPIARPPASGKRSTSSSVAASRTTTASSPPITMRLPSRANSAGVRGHSWYGSNVRRPSCPVGTGSPRRVAQLEALGLGLRTVPIRGNVDTRIGKVTSGELDAVVIAAAGLRRLGRVDEATELLDPLQMLPAPAQGALAVECRVADTALAALLAQVLDDEYTRAAVTAERAVLATLRLEDTL